jgi:hypothetical protein
MKKEQISGDNNEHGLRMNSTTKVFLMMPVPGEQLDNCQLILNFFSKFTLKYIRESSMRSGG